MSEELNSMGAKVHAFFDKNDNTTLSAQQATAMLIALNKAGLKIDILNIRSDDSIKGGMTLAKKVVAITQQLISISKTKIASAKN